MHHRTSCFLLLASRKEAMPDTQRIPTRDNIARSRSGSIRSVSGHRIVDDLHATSTRVCHVDPREFRSLRRCKSRARAFGSEISELAFPRDHVLPKGTYEPHDRS